MNRKFALQTPDIGQWRRLADNLAEAASEAGLELTFIVHTPKGRELWSLEQWIRGGANSDDWVYVKQAIDSLEPAFANVKAAFDDLATWFSSYRGVILPPLPSYLAPRRRLRRRWSGPLWKRQRVKLCENLVVPCFSVWPRSPRC